MHLTIIIPNPEVLAEARAEALLLAEAERILAEAERSQQALAPESAPEPAWSI